MKKWSEVTTNPEFQKLSEEEKEEARQNYFKEVVAPNVPEHRLNSVRQEFDQDTQAQNNQVRPKSTPVVNPTPNPARPVTPTPQVEGPEEKPSNTFQIGLVRPTTDVAQTSKPVETNMPNSERTQSQRDASSNQDLMNKKMLIVDKAYKSIFAKNDPSYVSYQDSVNGYRALLDKINKTGKHPKELVSEKFNKQMMTSYAEKIQEERKLDRPYLMTESDFKTITPDQYMSVMKYTIDKLNNQKLTALENYNKQLKYAFNKPGIFETTGAAAVKAGINIVGGIGQLPRTVQRTYNGITSKWNKYIQKPLGLGESFKIPDNSLFRLADTSGDVYNNLNKYLSKKYKSFAAVDKFSSDVDKGLTHALATGDYSKLGKSLHPQAILSFIAQAAPSLYAGIITKGNLGVVGTLEAMEGANSIREFEKRTGTKVSDSEYASAITRIASLNAVLEKIGIKSIMDSKAVGSPVKILTSAFTEASTEMLQQTNSNHAIKTHIDSTQSLVEGIIASGFGGAGAGGGIVSLSQFVQKMSEVPSKSEKTVIDWNNWVEAVNSLMEEGSSYDLLSSQKSHEESHSSGQEKETNVESQPIDIMNQSETENPSEPIGPTDENSASDESILNLNKTIEEDNNKMLDMFENILNKEETPQQIFENPGPPIESAPVPESPPLSVPEQTQQYPIQNSPDLIPNNEQAPDIATTPPDENGGHTVSEVKATPETESIVTMEDGTVIDEFTGEVVEESPVVPIKQEQGNAPVSDNAPVDFDTAVHEAATSPKNDKTEPTEKQKEAGNYPKGHVKVNGLDIAIENPKGSERSGTDSDGKPWSIKMKDHYGYIKRTEGADGDHIDVFVNKGAESSDTPVFVVDQVDPNTGKFDEVKVMIGYKDYNSAFAAYKRNYAKGWQGAAEVSEVTMEEFKQWLKEGDTKNPFALQEIHVNAVRGRRAKANGSTNTNSRSKKEFNKKFEKEKERYQEKEKAEEDKVIFANKLNDEAREILKTTKARKKEVKLSRLKKARELYEQAGNQEGVEKVDGLIEELNSKNKQSESKKKTSKKKIAKKTVAKKTASKEKSNGKKNKVKDEKSSNKSDDSKKGKIEDVGEKIGGARKDTSSKRGKTSAKKQKSGWRGRYIALENVLSGGEEFNIIDRRTGKTLRGPNYRPMKFTSMEEAEKVLPIAAVAEKHSITRYGEEGYSVTRRVSDRKRVRVVDEAFPTREEAMQFMAENAEAILDSKLNFGEEVLPTPEKVYRSGVPRRGIDENIEGQSFIDTFGFRGVEFGNWNNQKERQEVMNHAYDALLDMAEIIGISPKAISLNGDLALAFGARGQGLSGAKAHYEPGHAVINLTKMNGAGSLAHEWLHSLDHYFGRIDGKAAMEMVKNNKGHKVFQIKSDSRTFASHGFLTNSKARPEVQEAYKKLIVTMFRKAETYVEDTVNAEKFIGKTRDELQREINSILNELAVQKDPTIWKRNNKPASMEQLTRFDELADRLINGESLETELRLNENRRAKYPGYRHSNDTLDEMADIFKKVRGRSGFKSDKSGVIDKLSGTLNLYKARIKMLTDAKGKKQKEKFVPTKYVMQAKAADQARTGEYWSSPHEMAARAFAAYVEDKLSDKSAKNDFLAYHAHGAVLVPIYPEGLFRPYPEGRERTAINKEFDNLFEVIETKPTEKGEMLYSKSKDGSKGMSSEEVSSVLNPIISQWNEVFMAQVQIVNDKNDVPDDVKSRVNDSEAEGFADPVSGTVYILSNNINSPEDAQRVLAHEMIGHVGVENILGEALQSVLKSIKTLKLTNKKVRKIAEEVRQRYGKLSPEMEAKEIIAVLAEKKQKNSVIHKVINKLKAFLRKIGFNIDFGFTELVKLLQDSAKNLKSNNPKIGEQQLSDIIEFSKKAKKVLDEDELLPNASGWEKAKAKLNANFNKNSLAVLSRWQIVDIGKAHLPSIQEYQDLAQNLEGRRSELTDEVHEVVDMWRKWAGNHPEQAQELEEFMHESTVNGIDGSKLFTRIGKYETWAQVKEEIKVINEKAKGRSGEGTGKFMDEIKRIKSQFQADQAREKLYPKFKEQYDNFTDEQKHLYKKVRDFYTQRFDMVLKALEARVEQSKASKKEKQAKIRQLRLAFETVKTEGPYFPLGRFGDFWVSVKKKQKSNGKKKSKSRYEPKQSDVVEFQVFENTADQSVFVAKKRAEGFEVVWGKSIDTIQEVNTAGEGFMGNIMEIIDSTMSTHEGGKMKDTIYQLYLTTLPDLSVRKNFIHRKKTKGFSHDALRVFANQGFHGSYQLARLEHVEPLVEILEKMKSQLQDADNPVVATYFYEEMVKRHEWMLNPTSSSLSTGASSFAFVWMLGVTPAAAITNLTQTPLVAYPIMASEFGWGKSAKELLRASKHFVEGFGKIDRAKALQAEYGGDTARAYNELLSRGILDKTRAHDLANIADNETSEYNPRVHKFMEVVSFSFHHAERMNRETTAIATYRLARQAGYSHSGAVKKAEEVINEGHFNYSNVNKARLLHNDYARVAFIFKQYGMNMLYLLGRNFHQAYKGESKQVRSMARKKLFGVLGLHLVAGGATALPFIWTIAWLFGVLFDDPDDPWDPERELRSLLSNIAGQKISQMIMDGPVNAYGGFDLSKRISLSELLFRSPDRDMEGRATVQHWMVQLFGPLGGVITNGGHAWDLYHEGEYKRMFEYMTPKVIKDSLRAIRYSIEGAKNRSDDTIYDNFSSGQIISQVLGFTPSGLSLVYERNRTIRNLTGSVAKRRRKLLSRFANAHRRDDERTLDSVRNQIVKFNEKHPEDSITADSIIKSLFRRAKISSERVDGVYTKKKYRNLIREKVTF